MEFLNKFLAICFWVRKICWIIAKCRLKVRWKVRRKLYALSPKIIKSPQINWVSDRIKADIGKLLKNRYRPDRYELVSIRVSRISGLFRSSKSEWVLSSTIKTKMRPRGVFFVLNNDFGLKPKSRFPKSRFDCQRKADGSMPVADGNACLCGRTK